MAATTSSFEIPGSFDASGPKESLHYRNPFNEAPPPYSSTTTGSSSTSAPEFAEIPTDDPTESPEFAAPPDETPPPPPPPPPQEKTCRICLDTTTLSYDPELGRLLSPCKCRGSVKYVHEECLNRWRELSSNKKSYYQCTTCGYKYKLRRLRWGKWAGSKTLQFGLTISILLFTVWILGFIADPILYIYLNSYSLPSPPPQLRPGIRAPTSDDEDSDDLDPLSTFLPPKGSFAEHMLKGLTSLGLLGFAKVILFFGPQSWWNVRLGGGFWGGGRGGRPGGTGRDRFGQLGWLVVLFGVGNFFVWVWGRVSRWTRRWLEKAVDEILDIEEEEGPVGGS
ncbi:RING finger domain-containing protein [Peziza echinospora]|nr:RING finger domain-containing protein [Peziza echinospora]